MPTAISKRLYLKGLPSDTTKEELEKLLSVHGSITEVKILSYCAFVQFESSDDATRVLEKFTESDLLGKRVVIEYAHPMRRDTPSLSSSDNPLESATSYPNLSPTSRPNRIARHPIVVLDLPRDIGWKELKDFGRSSGVLVSFCDLDHVQTDRGFIEFFSREDAKHAVKVLNGQRLGGQHVRVVDHQGWRAYSGAYINRSNRGRSRSPGRLHQNRHTRAIRPAGAMSASPEYGSFAGCPGTYSYDAPTSERARHSRHRRLGENNYESYDHYARAVTFTGDHENNKDDYRSQKRLDIQIEQEASYLCHHRTRFATAQDTLQRFQHHHFDYYHHQSNHQDATYSDGHGFGQQYQQLWSGSNSDYHWPEHGREAGCDSTISDAEYPSRLDEAHLIQQRLTLHSYQ